MEKQPLMSSSNPTTPNPNPNPKGGIRTLPFIIANEAFERVASFGLAPNMIFYLTREYNMETKSAANILMIWSAATNLLPVAGAIAADTYLGRHRMIGFGSIASLLGMILLWFTAIFPEARPSSCGQTSEICESATTNQLMLLYASFGLMSIGAGGIRASSAPFGADQLIKGDNNLNIAGVLQSYFGWYSVSITVSYIVAVTCIVYIQDHFGWTVGFGIPVVLMLLSAISFFLASTFYVKLDPDANLLTGLAQVVVAAYKNRQMNVSSQATDEIYHQKDASNPIMPSENLRFLNKACIIRNPEQDLTPDGKASDPWRLCTVDQVEELKTMIRVIPICSTGIMVFVNVSQGSLGALQAKTMDRHITRNFEIPAGSLGLFMMLTLTLWIALYDRVIIPLASKIRGKPSHLSTKQRMSIGLIFSALSMALWAIAETMRRDLAIKQGFSDNPTGVVNMSVMWLLPHFIMDGLAEAFYMVAANEFLYCEFPRTMSSMAVGLSGIAMSVASLVASSILNAVDYVSKIGDQESWVSNNINKGHYDYYFWLLASFSMANFVYYLSCIKAYGPCKKMVKGGLWSL
ncbi:hypothetical protein Q3G72_031590 [Acer saccharum]|nr:hypothetical protein Q3G72_031590 [Acer saccharum]